MNCRYDWHQTSSDVVVSVFAKKYDPDSSFVQLNPIRLKVHLFFPEDQSIFSLDLELHGVRIICNCLDVYVWKGSETGEWMDDCINVDTLQLCVCVRECACTHASRQQEMYRCVDRYWYNIQIGSICLS